MNGAQTDGTLEPKGVIAGIFAPTENVSGAVASLPKLLFLLFLLTLPLLNPWVRGDGVGYYAYVRSPLIDHDLNFANDYLQGNESFVMSRVDAMGHLRPELYTKTGHVENHFSVGPAILWAPVLVTVHFVVLTLRHFGAHIAANGYSRPYILGMALSTACYGFLSLLLAYRITRKYFEQQWAFLATIGIWLASSLPVYMYFNPSWSHALSAFAVALFLWYWDRTKLQRSLPQWVLLGLFAGLLGNVYYPNVFVLMFPALEVIFLAREAQRSHARATMPIGTLMLSCGAFVAAFLVSLLPTFITRQIVYGSPFATGYPGIGSWHWASPALLQVLFSSDHGMWSWTPILFLAVMGLIPLYRRDSLLGAGAILTFGSFYYFIASYPDWDGLSSYGNRFFISLTPIFILSLAALLDSISRWVGSASRALVVGLALVVLLTVWNVGFVFQWGTHMIPARGKISWPEMLHNQFAVVPLRMEHSLETYFLHRRDMMQHIEQEDIEQQQTQGSREE